MWLHSLKSKLILLAGLLTAASAALVGIPTYQTLLGQGLKLQPPIVQLPTEGAHDN